MAVYNRENPGVLKVLRKILKPRIKENRIRLGFMSSLAYIFFNSMVSNYQGILEWFCDKMRYIFEDFYPTS